MDRLTGEPIAEYDLEFAPGASPVGDWENLFVPGFDGHMHALRWHGGRTGLAAQLWRVRTAGPLTSEATFDGRTLFFTSRDGTVHSCVGYSRIRNWSFRTAGPVSADIVLNDDHILVASQDRSLYSLDAGTGLVRWQRRLPSPLEDSPVVAGQTVYQRAPGEGLFAVDLAGGELLWRLPEARAFVAAGGDDVYLLATNGEHLLAVNNRTGKVTGSMEIADTRVVASNPDSDAVYLFSSWNRALCLRPADVPYLTLEEIAAVRNRISAGGTRLDSGIGPAAPTEADRSADLLDDPLRSRRDIAPVSGR
jgi:outer membrane protein assembly factor BamB